MNRRIVLAAALAAVRKLKLKTIALESDAAIAAQVSLGGKSIGAKFKRDGKKVVLTLNQPAKIIEGEKLEIVLT